MNGLAVPGREGAAEHLVAGDKSRERPLQSCDAEVVSEAERERHVVEIAAGFELVDEPQPLLREREGE